MDFSNLIMKDYIILIPFIYVVGVFLKQLNFHDNRLIPTTLLCVGIFFGEMIAISIDTNGVQLVDLINGMIQGVFCSGMAVYGNEILKCLKDYTNNYKDKDSK